MTTLLIADDHPLFREALRTAIMRSLPDARLYEADGVERLYQLADEHADADLLLLDLGMPGAHGFTVLAHLRGRHPQLPVVIVSATEDLRVMRRALDHGALGFIPKSVDSATIATAIRTVLDGECWAPSGVNSAPMVDTHEQEIAARVRDLTPHQFRVLQMLGSGRLNKQIAYDLNVSEATIKAHVTAILRKLGATNRTQAVLMAGRLALDPDGVVAPPDEPE